MSSLLASSELHARMHPVISLIPQSFSCRLTGRWENRIINARPGYMPIDKASASLSAKSHDLQRTRNRRGRAVSVKCRQAKLITHMYMYIQRSPSDSDRRSRALGATPEQRQNVQQVPNPDSRSCARERNRKRGHPSFSTRTIERCTNDVNSKPAPDSRIDR